MIVLNIGLCLIVMAILVIAIRVILDRTKALTHASFRDQTTQLLNRRAFEEDKEKLAANPLDEDFAYVTADLNGLKQANDHLGHTAGDVLIRGAADCLRAVFGPHGQVYRIGGDEFAVMMKIRPESLEQAMKELEEKNGCLAGRKGEGTLHFLRLCHRPRIPLREPSGTDPHLRRAYVRCQG